MYLGGHRTVYRQVSVPAWTLLVPKSTALVILHYHQAGWQKAASTIRKMGENSRSDVHQKPIFNALQPDLTSNPGEENERSGLWVNVSNISAEWIWYNWSETRGVQVLVLYVFQFGRHNYFGQHIQRQHQNLKKGSALLTTEMWNSVILQQHHLETW